MSIEESKTLLIELPHRYQGLQSHLLFPAKDSPGNDLLAHLPEGFDPKFPCARALEKMGAKSGDSEDSFMAGKDLFLKNGVKIWAG